MSIVTYQSLSQLSCQRLKGVGELVAIRLAKLNIHTIQDLLFHLPIRYQDRTRITPIGSLKSGQYGVIEGVMTSVDLPRGGKTRFLSYITDGTGNIGLRFFYMSAAQRAPLKIGVRLRCFGEVRFGARGLEMIHPEYKIVDVLQTIPVAEHLTPIYPTTEGLSQLTFRKLIPQALSLFMQDTLCNDLLPASVLQLFHFSSLKEALFYLHQPPPDASLELLEQRKHPSQMRLIFEELLAHHLSLLNIKHHFQAQSAPSLSHSDYLQKKLLAVLPFQLTRTQQKVFQEISQDLNKSSPMHRLLQGDVGSGKTIVATLALLQAVEAGYQGAIMAPTEILADQHRQHFLKWLAPLGICVAYVSGQMKAKEKKEHLEKIASGEAKIIVGTHALFQKEVIFSKLALIVIDEQHRFGVHQRLALREKGMQADKHPHQLVMTATPIPRTLAMSVYADMDHSVIDELPPGRMPIQTVVLSNERRDDVLMRIRDVCREGRQVYWVCTLIEESDTLQCQAAENTALQLQRALPDLKIGLVHGRLKTQEKENLMQAFKKGDIALLVATTVIEVGIDVPQASLMIIENAERLGLAQLHQLRGRIGRGHIASHCVLLYQSPLSAHARERLKVMRETQNGFVIAERDLELRGPGEVLGTRQTGDLPLKIADLLRDKELLLRVQEAADHIQPDQMALLIQRWLGNKEQYGVV